jgi:predicted transcriptional regulator
VARTLNQETAGSAPPKPGHNMPPEVIQQWFTRIVKLDEDWKAANEEAKAAKSTLAAEYKLFKDAGGNVKVMKKLVKERNEDRSQIALDKMAEEAYREALKMVIETGDLVAGAEALPPVAHANEGDDKIHAALDRAEDDGYFAAKDGKPRNTNPHPVGSELEHRWFTGWDKYAMDAFSEGGKKTNGTGKGGRRKAVTAEAGAAAH